MGAHPLHEPSMRGCPIRHVFGERVGERITGLLLAKDDSNYW